MDRDEKYYAASETDFEDIGGFLFPKPVEVSLERKIELEEKHLSSIFNYYDKFLDKDLLEAISIRIMYIIRLKGKKLKQDHCE